METKILLAGINSKQQILPGRIVLGSKEKDSLPDNNADVAEAKLCAYPLLYYTGNFAKECLNSGRKVSFGGVSSDLMDSFEDADIFGSYKSPEEVRREIANDVYLKYREKGLEPKELPKIINSINKHNKEIADDLVDLMLEKKIEPLGIAYILKSINADNADVVPSLLRELYGKGVTWSNLEYIFLKINKVNKEFLPQIVEMFKKKEVKIGDISDILIRINKSNKGFAANLLEICRQYKVPSENIDNFLRIADEDNMEYISRLFELFTEKRSKKASKNKDGSKLRSEDYEGVLTIMSRIDEENKEVVPYLIKKCSQGAFSKEEFFEILHSIGKENIAIVPELIEKYKKFGLKEYDVVDVLMNTNGQNLGYMLPFFEQYKNYKKAGVSLRQFLRLAGSINAGNKGFVFGFYEQFHKKGLPSRMFPEMVLNLGETEVLRDLMRHDSEEINDILKKTKFLINELCCGEIDEDCIEEKLWKAIGGLSGIYKIIKTYDCEALDIFAHKSAQSFYRYAKKIDDFSGEDLVLLKRMTEMKNVYGQPFSPKQKAEFISIIDAYNFNRLPKDSIEKMVQDGQLDVKALCNELISHIMKYQKIELDSFHFNPDWDEDSVCFLFDELGKRNEKELFDILQVIAKERDFKTFLRDEENPYGKANAATENLYYAFGLDYSRWLQPFKDQEVRVVLKDEKLERLAVVTYKIEQEIDKLRHSEAGEFVSRRVAGSLKGEKFSISRDITASKDALGKYTDNLIRSLNKVWTRAEQSAFSDDPMKQKSGEKTLEIKKNLVKLLDEIEEIKNEYKTTGNLDVTIRMWDRNPAKDLFQGNFSTCCIGMGQENSISMLQYMLNNAFNMIEIVDNKRNKVIGNALCCFVYDKRNIPVFVLDNVEINNMYKLSLENQRKLRSSLIEFATGVCEEVSGRDDTGIIISNHNNDIFCGDLKSAMEKIDFIGSLSCNEIYMDIFGGWVEKALSKRVLYKILKN